MKTLLGVAAAVMMTGAAVAQQATPVDQGSGAKAERKVCRSEGETGSHFSKKVCRTKSEWSRLDAESEEARRSMPQYGSMGSNHAQTR